MNDKLYTIYDTVACEAGPIFNARNDDVACRYVVDMLLRQYKGQLVEEDYKLYQLGSFDTELPFVESITPKEINYKPAFEKSLGKRIETMDIQRKMFENAQNFEEVKK